eukprot:COSAG02_NODE_7867_length_2811_cov_6.892440_1_plen_133_part_00
MADGIDCHGCTRLPASVQASAPVAKELELVASAQASALVATELELAASVQALGFVRMCTAPRCTCSVGPEGMADGTDCHGCTRLPASVQASAPVAKGLELVASAQAAGWGERSDWKLCTRGGRDFPSQRRRP